MVEIYGKNNASFIDGCDFVLDFDKDISEIKLLQLTDMQIIDASQRRTSDRLRPDEIKAWARNTVDINCYNHIRSVIAQTSPDYIFITGDMVYGSFDDSGEILKEFIRFMDSFDIPWSIVWGNHDNESQIGIDEQCRLYTNSKNCVFNRGKTIGNSNYTVGISVNKVLKRTLYFLDTHGVVRNAGIHKEQLEFCLERAKEIEKNSVSAPSFMITHIPVDLFNISEIEKGYLNESKKSYVIGVDVESKDGDFGFSFDSRGSGGYIKTDELFKKGLEECNVDGIFAGHYHNKCSCIHYNNLKLIFGLKSSQYDYYTNGHIGATLVTFSDKEFKIQYIPSFAEYAPVPALAPSFKNIIIG